MHRTACILQDLIGAGAGGSSGPRTEDIYAALGRVEDAEDVAAGAAAEREAEAEAAEFTTEPPPGEKGEGGGEEGEDGEEKEEGDGAARVCFVLIVCFSWRFPSAGGILHAKREGGGEEQRRGKKRRRAKARAGALILLAMCCRCAAFCCFSGKCTACAASAGVGAFTVRCRLYTAARATQRRPV